MNLSTTFTPEVFFLSDRDVVFRLYTRLEENRIVKLYDALLLTDSTFNVTQPTRFIIHGWRASGKSKLNFNIRREYLRLGAFNVFIVDWGAGSNSVTYIRSKRRVKAVGKTVSDFIDFLHQQTGMDLTTVTVIGHSLGAHIGGMAGKHTQKRGKIGVIVGLDPARLFFSMNKPTSRLHYSDALYVESIHTNARRMGLKEPIGHASFYPNFGRTQVCIRMSVVKVIYLKLIFFIDWLRI